MDTSNLALTGVSILSFLSAFFVGAGTWYLKASIPKWIGHKFAEQLEEIKAENARNLEVVKSQLAQESARRQLFSQKIVALHDELFPVIGEFKIIALTKKTSDYSDPNGDWLNKGLQRVRYFAQAWWPYYSVDLIKGVP